MKVRISRRRFLGGVSFAAAGAFSYARWFEAERLERSFVNVPFARAGRPPIKLLHLSDLHASAVVSLEYIGRALDAAVDWQPDIICVTGDFITRTFRDPSGYASVLRQLSAVAPTFASLGNHDGGKWSGENGGYSDIHWIQDVLERSHIRLLQNEAACLRIAGREINVVGVGDTWADDLDAGRAFRECGEGETIVLSHNPDTKDALATFGWNLMLSGHTHGGQLRVPWIGATPFAPVRDKRFVEGLRAWNGRWIHVTRGIGSVFGVRINCPPELSFLNLT